MGPDWDIYRKKSKEFVDMIFVGLKNECDCSNSNRPKKIQSLLALNPKVAGVFKTLWDGIRYPVKARLQKKLLSDQATITEALELYSIYVSHRQAFPLHLEERVILLCLAEEPNRHDLLYRLRDVLKLQGKRVPQNFDLKMTELQINWVK